MLTCRVRSYAGELVLVRWGFHLAKPSQNLPAYFTLETGVPGIVHTFVEYEDFRNFLDLEIQRWQWLNDSEIQGKVPNNPFASIVNSWRHVSGQLPAYQSRPANYQNAIKSMLTGHILNNGIPISGTPKFSALEQMKDADKLTAAFAVAFQMNHMQPTGRFEHFAAAFEFLTMANGLTSKSVSATNKVVSDLLAKQSAQFSVLADDTYKQRNVFEKERQRTRRFLTRTVAAHNNSFRSRQTEQSNQFEATLQRLSDVEAAYRQHMKLKAPVEYWSDKAKQHKTRATTYRKYLAWFAALGGAALIGGLFCLSEHAISVASQDKPSAVYFILATIGVVCSTIVFWVARILTRLFLSEHHLAIDAEERSTMVQTFLALTLDGKVSDAERTLVLASLFRPTADGIVKDDGAPDISPASMISRVLSQKS